MSGVSLDFPARHELFSQSGKAIAICASNVAPPADNSNCGREYKASSERTSLRLRWWLDYRRLWRNVIADVIGHERFSTLISWRRRQFFLSLLRGTPPRMRSRLLGRQEKQPQDRDDNGDGHPLVPPNSRPTLFRRGRAGGRRSRAIRVLFHAFCPQARFHTNSIMSNREKSSYSRRNGLDDFLGQFTMLFFLPLDFQDAVDGFHLLGIAENVLLNHVVLPQPEGHFAPEPEPRAVKKFARRRRKAAWSTFPRPVLMNKLAATFNLPGEC